MEVEFPSGAWQLEGDVVVPPQPAGAAVVCHPHPQYGGNMDNNIVRTMTDVLGAAGWATLRFNFRGVGASSGAFGGGVEAEDARAAVAFLGERMGLVTRVLAGYSFGAMVALQAGVQIGTIDQLIAVAPPLAFIDLGFLRQCSKRKLFIVGDDDQYCPIKRLQDEVSHLVEPKAARVIGGADHFFFGFENAVADAVRGALA